MNKNYKLIPFFLFYILLTLYVSDNFFFWDTIQLGAKHGLYFYESNFESLLLPDEIDSGHIPGFGMYLALCWKIFGKTLLTSHLAMLPFLLGIVYQVFRLIRSFIGTEHLYISLIIFLLDPTLLAQSILMSPDIPIVFFFLLLANSVLQNEKTLLTIASIGLVLSSMRGMMIVMGMGVYHFYYYYIYKKNDFSISSSIKLIRLYIPSAIIVSAFLIYHYMAKSWIGYHEDSPWVGSFEKVGVYGMMRNAGIMVWRIIDFGRIFLIFAIIPILISKFSQLVKDKKLISLSILLIISVLALSYSFLTYMHLNGHRYILIIFLMINIISSYLISHYVSRKKL